MDNEIKIKSLQECKDEVARKSTQQYMDWEEVLQCADEFYQDNLHDQAAELHASQFQAVIAEKEKEIEQYKKKENLHWDYVKRNSGKKAELECTIEAQNKEIESLKYRLKNLGFKFCETCESWYKPEKRCPECIN